MNMCGVDIMSGNKQVYIHPGLPKSASTFLQDNVFGRIPDCYFPHRNPESPLKKIVRTILRKNYMFIDINEERRVLENFYMNRNESKFLLSWETFCGSFSLNLADHEQRLNITKKLFPNAKILLVLRRQDDFIESWYAQYIKKGLVQDVFDYLNLKNGKFGDYRPIYEAGPNIDIKSLNWYSLVKNYEQLFGRENLLVIPYELLRKDRDAFLSRLYKFFECDWVKPDSQVAVNRRYSKISYMIANILNRIVRYPFNSGGFIDKNRIISNLQKIQRIKCFRRTSRVGIFILKKTTVRNILEKWIDNTYYLRGKLVKTSIKKSILKRHEHSNRMLSEEYSLSLEDHGYF